MIDFINYLINGALVGLLYALIAMGFVVIYRASKVFNFAQGELVVFGGFIVWWTVATLGLPLWLALSAALPPNWSPILVFFGITIILGMLDWPGLARAVRSNAGSLRIRACTSAICSLTSW